MKSIGKIIYSPTSHLGQPKNWAILMCDDEISKYYRSLYSKEYRFLNGEYPFTKLTRPVWGTHISFIRKEKPSIWGKNQNQIIEFEYFAGAKDNGDYFWLDVKCDYLLDLRESLGLTRNPKFGLHLTFGKIN